MPCGINRVCRTEKGLCAIQSRTAGAKSLGYSSLQQYFDVSKIVVARIEEAIR